MPEKLENIYFDWTFTVFPTQRQKWDLIIENKVYQKISVTKKLN